MWGFIYIDTVNHIFQPTSDDKQQEEDSLVIPLETAMAGTSAENLDQHDGILLSLR